MINYNFILVLSGITEPTEKLEDALFEAGCDDATLAFCNQLAYLEFDREALSFTEAVISAIKQVKSIERGINIERVEPNKLLTVEILRIVNGRQDLDALFSDIK